MVWLTAADVKGETIAAIYRVRQIGKDISSEEKAASIVRE
jgi:hypothetical protein